MSPNVKLNIVFWAVTAPFLPFIVTLILLGAIIAIVPLFRSRVMNAVEKIIYKFAIWRNNLPIIKNAYDKAHLFDYLRNSN